ncbi:hypothetical protein J1N35_026094 [Gossypium stocksii]|uniref:Dof zinc finger protein n=1 Tax=Gossypium stocksii TaxID=47602 RepID=A0A9D3V883_9ROSI|nr:hypothetical protein J1N35_026094 [Gossypium stocksii]
MDADKWSQGFQVKSTEEMMVANNNTCTKGTTTTTTVLEKKTRPPEQLNCPRCNSTNTKFCYYNNYSLTQPRYFCKTCRRYWTEGGSLRNVPVGGGSRKNKRSSISTTSSSSSSSSSSTAFASDSAKVLDLNPSTFSLLSSSQNPNKVHYKGQDLNLTFPPMQEPGLYDHQHNYYYYNNTGMVSRGLNSFVPAPAAPATLFSMQDYKPTLSSTTFPIHSGVQGFPFGEMKQVSSTNNEVDDDQNKEQSNSTGFWNNNGVLGGGGSW